MNSQVSPKHLLQFFSKVQLRDCLNEDLPGPCWIWTGAQDKSNGSPYGKVKIAGKMQRAHRWIYHQLIRELRVDEDAHHECEVSLCVNPFHITPLPVEMHSKRGPPVNYDWGGGVTNRHCFKLNRRGYSAYPPIMA